MDMKHLRRPAGAGKPEEHDRITRRRFGATTFSAFASFALADGCLESTANTPADGRLDARPRPGVARSLESGPLGLGKDDRDGVVRVPPSIGDAPLPLLVFLHGATQTGAGMIRRIGPAADAAGVAVLAPDSRGTTWDAIRGEFGEDVTFLNHALERVFARLPVDPGRIAIGGFSDGASYGLSLGLANGDLFSRVVAFSPGFLINAA